MSRLGRPPEDGPRKGLAPALLIGTDGSFFTSPQEAADSQAGNAYAALEGVGKGVSDPRTSGSTFPRFLEVPEWPVLSGPRANVQHTMHAHSKSGDGRDRR